MPQKTMAEYVAVQRTDIERPEANLNVAAVQVEQNRLEEAEASLRTAPELCNPLSCRRI